MNIVLDIDGPRDHEYVLEVAEALAECPRVLNHLTMSHGAIRYAAEADTVIRFLAATASRLPQLLGQLAQWLAAEQAQGRLETHGGDYATLPAMAQAAVSAYLEEASVLAVQMQQALDAAARITNDMATAAGDGEDGDG